MGLADIFSEVIEKMLAQSQVQQDRVLTPDNVFQEKHDANRTVMYPIVQKLLLEGSGIEGLDNLAKLGEIAGQGGSCLILAEHLSNFDVPVFWTLMHALGEESEALFDRIVFIAGRKLNEESAVVKLFTEMFTRIVISPKTFEDDLPDGDEGERLKAEAQAINMAAYRKIRELKKAGRIFLVYPTGTRFRPWEPSTGRGLREVEGYLRSFDNICFMACIGNLMPPEQGKEMAAETPRRDRVVMRFGPVRSSESFRSDALKEYAMRSASGEELPEEKQFVMDCVMREIAALHSAESVQ